MNYNLLHILLILPYCMVGLNLSAHDIEVPNADGEMIYYSYFNDSTELAVAGGDFNIYTSMKTLVIPDEVTYDYNTLKVTSIGYGAFSFCPYVTSIAIPNSVTIIENDAFDNCTSLKFVTIPNSVTTIGEYAFRCCISLDSIIIGNHVTTIGKSAFDSCVKLASVTISNSVKTIGEAAFRTCGLTSVIIGDGVMSIGPSAFYGCRGLSSVIIPNDVTTIGDFAFLECRNVTSVSIGSGVKNIGRKAFSGLNNLTDVICMAIAVPETANQTYNAFESSNFNATLHVPEASLEAYQTTAPWSEFKNIVPITPLGINAQTATNQTTIVKCYDLTGRRASIPQRGVNILKVSDGTTKKVVVK